MAKKNSSKGQWKKLENQQAPFWQPWNEKMKHPDEIEGVVVEKRDSNGQFGQTVLIDVQCDEETAFTLDTKTAGLRPLRRVGVGQLVRVVYTGEEKVEGRASKAHACDCFVQE